MPKLIIEGKEFYDEASNSFYQIEPTIYNYEHSLLSISKWESITKKRFIATFENKASKEDLYIYIKCMIKDADYEDIDDKVIKSIPQKELLKMREYIDDPMTATTFYQYKNPNSVNAGRTEDKTSSELIYYWMFSVGIPKECETWNFNRLLTLIRIFTVKESGGKMSKRDQAAMFHSLNKERRAKSKRK